MGYPGHRDGPAARDKQLFARHAMPLPDNRIEVPSWLIVRQLVLENDFIAALPGLIELYGLFGNEGASVAGGYPRWGFVSLR
jgi:DNA-binding transcriptional LysR family regulator